MICNYADDNRLLNESNCINTLKISLEKDAHRKISWFYNDNMNANPDKFQCISLDRFSRPPVSITAEGNTISPSDSIEVLGVTLDSRLQHHTHISNLCSKASTQINAMKRTGKYGYILYVCFFFILSGFLDVLWETKFRWNGKVAREGSPFLYFLLIWVHIYLLNHGNFLPIFALRIRYLVIEMYKLVHVLNPPYLNEFFVSENYRYNLHGSKLLQQPELQTIRCVVVKSFRYCGSRLWNALPNWTKTEKSENWHHFKKNVTQWCVSSKCGLFIIQENTLYMPFIWNISHHFIGFIGSNVYLQ